MKNLKKLRTAIEEVQGFASQHNPTNPLVRIYYSEGKSIQGLKEQISFYMDGQKYNMSTQSKPRATVPLKPKFPSSNGTLKLKLKYYIT